MFGEPVKQLVKHKEFSLPDVPEVGILSSDHRDAVTGKRVYQGGSWSRPFTSMKANTPRARCPPARRRKRR
jgi:hypothetical protein